MCPSGRRSSIANRVLGETLTEGSNPSISTRYTIQIPYAPLAQLDRASGYGPEGQEFESLRVYLEASVERLGLFWFLYPVKWSATLLDMKLIIDVTRNIASLTSNHLSRNTTMTSNHIILEPSIYHFMGVHRPTTPTTMVSVRPPLQVDRSITIERRCNQRILARCTRVL